eukprot:TRINITY_DN22599_c0_g1_i1.p1 TRINITY_DN22599_c0_g1~~TRINITY_DN22599_c0_g1_i1.p1  ORF type:complete len:952 (+),score=389.99 TRINITY_DN22599_c0_g1_i1:91-2856(+)
MLTAADRQTPLSLSQSWYDGQPQREPPARSAADADGSGAQKRRPSRRPSGQPGAGTPPRRDSALPSDPHVSEAAAAATAAALRRTASEMSGASRVPSSRRSPQFHALGATENSQGSEAQGQSAGQSPPQAQVAPVEAAAAAAELRQFRMRAQQLRMKLPGGGGSALSTLDVLQQHHFSPEELLDAAENRATTEELLEFLKMGEKRVVDLAVKVKLLETMNDDLHEQRSAAASSLAKVKAQLETANERLRCTQAALRAKEQQSEQERRVWSETNSKVTGSIQQLEGTLASLQGQLEATRRDHEAEKKLHKEREHTEGKKLKEATGKANHFRTQHDKVAKDLKEKERELREKKELIAERNKEIQAIQGRRDKLESERRAVQQALKAEKESKQQTLTDETARLSNEEQEFREDADKLSKLEEVLAKEKANIRQALSDAIRELQDQREREHQQLLSQKQDFEQELQKNFQSKQGELDEHWGQKYTQELQLMEERRKTFEDELGKMRIKTQENRQRLERHSQRLEKYGRDLRRELGSWKSDKQNINETIDKATKEKEEVEAQLTARMREKDLELQDFERKVMEKDRAMDAVREEMAKTKQAREDLLREQAEWHSQHRELEKKETGLISENARLIEDNTLLEKNFNELKCEHDQLLEEMTYMRSREEEERELRRKTNEMLLASYRYKHAGSNELIASPGDAPLQEDEGAIDLLCWKCHQKQLEDEGSGLLARARDARRQMRTLTVDRRMLQNEREAWLKANRVDSEHLAREAADMREAREELQRETHVLAAERKALRAEQALKPRLQGTKLKESASGDAPELWASLAVADPDLNPVPVKSGERSGSGAEGALDAARRRKRDLVSLQAVYAASPARKGARGRARNLSTSRARPPAISPPSNRPGEFLTSRPSGEPASPMSPTVRKVGF